MLKYELWSKSNETEALNLNNFKILNLNEDVNTVKQSK